MMRATPTTPAGTNQPTIEIIDIRRTERQDGTLKAFVNIRIAGKLEIYGARVIQQSGQDPWVALPQTEKKSSTPGGKSQWFPIVKITDKALKEQIDQAVLDAYGRADGQQRAPEGW